MPQYKSPTGALIIGTKEIVPGIALINGISEDGEPEYDGETDVDWNGQTSVLRDGKPLFVDENEEEWTFDQLTVSDDEDEDEEG